MASEYVFLKGKAKWCRTNTPDAWGNWKTNLYPDAESLNKFKSLGVKNHVKKDEDGEYVVLRRPQQKMMRGKVVGFAPPIVQDAEGNQTRDIMIGNGSDITCKIEVYSYISPTSPTKAKEKALRWESVRIDNLVPFVGNKDLAPVEEKQVRGLAEQPAPLF